MNVSEDDELSIFIISYISHQIQKLKTKVIRRFPKISQSQRRPLLELSHLKHQAKQDMLINLPVPYDLGVCVPISRLQWVNACLAVP